MHLSTSRKTFLIGNYIFLAASAFLCLFPILHVLAISFSSAPAAAAGEVKLWPVDFSLASYQFVATKGEFWTAFGITLQRIGLAIPITMVLIVLAAYPLSKDSRIFKLRNVYTYFLLIPMLFSGGMIPWYMLIRKLGLMDSVWALVLPGAVPVFSVILLMNFFRNLPSEIEDAAFIDGAGPLTSLLKIYIPLSTPCLATITLFSLVGHWNSWFDGLILMNTPDNYPLQSYLQTVVIVPDVKFVTSKNLSQMAEISDRTSKAAQIFVGTLPILLVYPFLQRYFTKGIVLGSVKG